MFYGVTGEGAVSKADYPNGYGHYVLNYFCCCWEDPYPNPC